MKGSKTSGRRKGRTQKRRGHWYHHINREEKTRPAQSIKANHPSRSRVEPQERERVGISGEPQGLGGIPDV